MIGKNLNKKFSELTNRNINIIKKLIVLIVCLLLSIVSIKLALNSNKKVEKISYNIISNIDYDVSLKENKFFSKDDTKNNKKYIASLIDKITGKYDYELAFNKEKIDYTYSYFIEAEVDIKEPGSDKTIYHTVEKLHEKEETNYSSSNNLKISEEIIVDYNHYNSIVKEFIATYGLTDVESSLEINMHVLLNKSEEKIPNETILTLSLPLTTKTVDVNIKSNVVEISDNNLTKEVNSITENVFIAISFLLVLVDAVLILFLVKYILNTRSKKAFYESELNKIMNNYSSYIQKVNTINENANDKDINIIELETFDDMLEIRDNLNSPILMFQNDENTLTQFKILDINNKVVYIYTLNVD